MCWEERGSWAVHLINEDEILNSAKNHVGKKMMISLRVSSIALLIIYFTTYSIYFF